MASEFERDRIKSDFLNLTFVADEYEINFDKLSEGEEEDQYTGKFRVRSRSVPAYGSLEEGEERRRSSSIGAMGRKSRNSARNSERTSHMSSRRSTDSANAEVQGSDSSAKGRRSSLQSRASGVERSSVHSPRSSSVPPRQGISMVFSEDDRMSLQSSGEEPRDSLTGKRHSSLGAGIGRGRESQALENGSNMQRLSRISEEVISSGASQTEASEEWCTKTLTSRSLHKVSKKDAEMMDTKKMDVIVTAKDSVNFETVPLVEVRSSSSHGIRSHGTMEWIPGHTLHFDVPTEVKQHAEIHLELLPFGNPPQGIIDGKMALDVAEKYEQVPLKSGALGIQVRMKPGKQRGTKKGLKWHPEVRDGRTFAGGNRRNTPFQPLYPIAETPDGNAETRMSEGRISDPSVSEVRVPDPRMSQKSMLEDRVSAPRMSEGGTSAPRMSEARMSDGRMSDPRMSEARMSEARMSDPRMSEARMSDGRMSDPRMSEARMSEARMSDGRMSDSRMSEARMSDGRMSDPRMSEARMSEARMSDPRMSEARMSQGSMQRASQTRASDARASDVQFSPSVASMQLDVAEMEARNTVRSNPRYSNRMSASSARASVADRRSTARSSIAVKMQQDPGDATDSSLASINDHRESTERMSLGASLQAQSGSIYSPYVEDAPKRSLRGSQSMPCSMPMASDSEKTSDSQNSQIPSPMVAASDDGSRQGESLGELSQSRTSRSSVPRTSRTSQSRRMSSRASRLSKAKNESTGGTARAVCRFTHPEAVNFCGLEIVACKCQEAENLAGRDRSALLVLLEQAGKSVEAARQMKGSDAAAMPRLVAHLSSELTLHGRELRAGRLQAVGSEPVFLAVLSQLIEVLDTLVPLPNLPENSLVLGKDWSLGGEIRPQYTESLLESLRQAFGSHGFLPECVECLRCINQTELPYVVMDELKLVTLLALRLALAWDTPSTVQRPLEVMIECKGYEVLLDHLLQLIASFKGDVSETTLPQLALALEAVYLMLCSDSGLEQLCGSESKVRSNNARKTSPLAAVALDTIELLAQGWKEATHAVNSVLPAAVNILALLLNATPMALAASTDQIVRALCQIISHETLTPRLISSMLQLVRPPQKPRIWLGSVGDAVQIRKKLRQSLIRNKVPSMVAIAAKEKLETLLQQHGELSLSLNGPVSKAVEKRASQVIAAGSYYDNVEAFVSEVYGSAGAVDVEEEMADFRNAVDDLDDDISRADRRRSSMLMSALSNMRQAIFENCLMPQTRRRNSRVV